MNLRGGVLIGVQVPRLRLRPERVSSAGEDAIDLAASCGLHLMPAQQLVVDDKLGELEDGSWATKLGVVIESRQNGKGGIIEAEMLEGLFLSELPMQLYTAQLFPTAMLMFNRLLNLIEAGNLDNQIRRVSRSHGEEGITLRTGPTILFKTRTPNAGRGMTVHRLYVDEAYNYPVAQAAALEPTTIAAPNSQIGYYSSPGDIEIADCTMLGLARARAVKAIDGKTIEQSLQFAEWSVPYDVDTGRVMVDPADPASWAMGNPAMNILIHQDAIESAQRTLPARSFAIEHLGVGRYPRPEGGDKVIPDHVATLSEDGDSRIRSRLMFALEVTPEQSAASICAAGFYDYLEGQTPDDVDDEAEAARVWHVERVQGGAGTTWTVPRLKVLCATYDTVVAIDVRSPAASLIPELEKHEVPFLPLNTSDVIDGSKAFYGLLMHRMPGEGEEPGAYEPLIRRTPGQRSVTAAMGAAVKAPIGEGGWKFGRATGTGIDMTPLIGCVLALRAAMVYADDNYDATESVY